MADRGLFQVEISGANLKKDQPRFKPFTFAVDDGNHTLQSVFTALSRELTTGKITRIPVEEALEKNLFGQFLLDLLTADLLLEATSIKDSMKISWFAADGFVPTRRKVLKEYRLVRNLIPIKINILGPRYSGKTTLSKRLCEFYKLHHITPENIVEHTEEELWAIVDAAEKEKAAAPVKAGSANQEPAEEEEEEKPVDRVGKAKRLLVEIESSKNENEGKITEDLIVRLVREKLMEPRCANQGYVLDGFPESKEEALKVFAPIEKSSDEDDEAEDEDEFLEEDDLEDIPPHEKKLVPGG